MGSCSGCDTASGSRSIGSSSLLGPIAGIMIADYHIWRRRQLAVEDLYRHDGQYRSTGGFSLVGFAS